MKTIQVKPNRVLLFSGGLDSYIAWHLLKHPPTVYFDLGTEYTKREMDVVNELVPSTIMDYSLSLREREEASAFIPMRNLYLAMLACKYGDEIIIAGLKDDVVNDKNKEIFKEFSKILTKLNNRKIVVTSPFWKRTKSNIVKLYLDNNGSPAKLLKTISCYSPSKDYPDNRYCGECKSCFRKWVALWVNGIHLTFHSNKLMDEYFQKAKKGFYIQQRNKTIIRAITEYSNSKFVLELGKKTIAVDIDGVLTVETQGHNYATRTPNLVNIEMVNQLAKRNIIVLYSSRYPQDLEETTIWLKKHLVQYDRIILGKPSYDFIVDDKAIKLSSMFREVMFE